MRKGQNFLIKPGTIFLILIIALVLFGLFSWASDTMEESGEQSLQDQQDAIVCSSLEVDFVDRDSNETHQFVYLQVNQDVEDLMVEFRGSGNHTHKMEYVEKNSVTRASAPLESISEVKARARGCDRVFG